jgi:hypothetical protein
MCLKSKHTLEYQIFSSTSEKSTNSMLQLLVHLYLWDLLRGEEMLAQEKRFDGVKKHALT